MKVVIVDVAAGAGVWRLPLTLVHTRMRNNMGQLFNIVIVVVAAGVGVRRLPQLAKKTASFRFRFKLLLLMAVHVVNGQAEQLLCVGLPFAKSRLHRLNRQVNPLVRSVAPIIV